MTITIKAASVYSINGGSEMAHELEYSEGTRVRAVTSQDAFIRKEYHNGREWVLSGKPYRVKVDRKRQAERIVATCREMLAQ